MRKTPRETTLASLALCLLLAVPAIAETRIEREFDMRPGGLLALDTDIGSVEVIGHSPRARVEIRSDRDDLETLMDFTFEQRDGGLEIVGEKKGKTGLSRLFNGSRGERLHYRIEVPTDTELDIDTSGGSISVSSTHGRVRLDTSGGAIDVEGVRGNVDADTSGGSISIVDVDGDVIADTSGGSIRVEGVRGTLEADTSGGTINITDVTGDLTADTSGGSIHISDAGGSVRAETSGGSIEVAFAPGNSRGGSLAASGGGIRVSLDPASDLEIDAASSGGSIESDLPISVRGERSKTRLRGTLGSGGERLQIRSSGGPIRIRER